MDKTAFSPEEHRKLASDDLLQMMWSLRRTATDVVSPLGVTPFEAMTLTYIARGYTSPKALASVLRVHASSLSATITSFAARDLIKRPVDTQDKRRSEIRLTPAGESAVGAIELAWQDAHKPKLEGFAPEELQTLTKLCLVIAASGES